MKMGVSIGMVGLGAFGSAFADMYKSHPLVDRIALCDREPDRIRKFADKPAFRNKFNERDAYTSFEAILESDIDALVIITQPWLHAPQAVKAMERGKHVYSAVPIISIPDGDETLEWCDKIVKTSQATGMRYMLGETTFYHPQTMYCRKMTAAGKFGRFVFAEGEYFHDVDLPTCNLRDVQKHRTASTSGKEWLKVSRDYERRGHKSGPMHYPTHSVSGPLCVMNTWARKVVCLGFEPDTRDEFFKDSAFSNETAFFELANGTPMRICEYRDVALMGREGFAVYGTGGTFFHGDRGYGESRWMDRAGVCDLTVEEMRDPLPLEVYEAFKACSSKADAYGGHHGSHAYLVHEFVDAVAHGRQPAINAWVAVRYMAAGVMAHKSALKGGQQLDVPDWGEAPK
jgi:predicted dehydrogenase